MVRSMLLLVLSCLVAIISNVQHVSARAYGYYTYQEIVGVITDLQAKYPTIIEIQDAQTRYGLPSPGLCGNADCKHYIVRLGLRSVQDDETPEVFFSGALHGNERVGPNAVTEFLVFAAETYAGVRPANPWITRLIETRSIYVMPTTNAKGYNDATREEISIQNGVTTSFDPNRDYAYNMRASTPNKCMETITARATNELFREHMFQLAITFHGGIHMITTEWGSFNHYLEPNGPNNPTFSTLSPDDYAQNAIAGAMSAFAGAMPSETVGNNGGLFPHGRSNDLLYAVYGGMEDWGYAASWDTTGKAVCKPTTFGGYPEAKTTYTDAMFRTFNILVETSGSKTPSAALFGQDVNVLRPEAAEDGHISRNIRLALHIVDIVQPYIQLVAPTVATTPDACSAAQKFPSPADNPGNLPTTISAKSGEPVAMSWEVGGAMTVDETFLMWAPMTADLVNLDATKPGFGLSSAGLVTTFGKFDTAAGLGATEGRSAALTGFTRWAGGSTFGKPVTVNEDAFLDGADIAHDKTVWDRQASAYIPAFSACATMPTTPGTYYVMARAKVDQKWGNKPNPADPNLDPQSHIVNARTKNSWPLSNNGRKIRAQVNWYSVPVKVIVSVDGLATVAPSSAPTGAPSAAPTAAPSATPTGSPSAMPTGAPSATPTGPPVAPGAPTSAPVAACRCKNTLGAYGACVQYDSEKTACLLSGIEGKSEMPKCSPPLGAASAPRWSDNYAGWFVYGCTVGSGALGTDLTDALPLEGGEDEINLSLLVGIAVGAVSLIAIGAVVMHRRGSQTRSALPTRHNDTTKERTDPQGQQFNPYAGKQSGNPMFGGGGRVLSRVHE